MGVRLALDNSVVNRLVTSTGEDTLFFRFLREKTESGDIEVFAIPTNIVEIALCPELEKRHQMAKRFNLLIDGYRIDYPWDARFLLYMFEELEETWPGIIKDKSAVFQPFIPWNQMLLGRLGQMAALPNYNHGKFEGILKDRMANYYYQIRLISDGDFWLGQYKKQLQGDSIAESAKLDEENLNSMTSAEIKAKVDALKMNPKPISDIVQFRKLKKELGCFFAKDQAWMLFLNGFRFREQIEEAFDFAPMVQNWQKLLPTESKPTTSLHPDLVSTFSDGSVPTSKAYYGVFARLIQRMECAHLFPINHMMQMYFDELELILNVRKESKAPSEGLAFDLDYYPATLVGDKFISADAKLVDSIKKLLLPSGRDSKVILYQDAKHSEFENILSCAS